MVPPGVIADRSETGPSCGDPGYWLRFKEGSYSSFAVIDRLAYDNYEPLVMLAALAAVTRRIRLMTAAAASTASSTSCGG